MFTFRKAWRWHYSAKKCLLGFIPNSIKKSVTVSNIQVVRNVVWMYTANTLDKTFSLLLQSSKIARSALMQISGCCFTSITITCIETSNFTVKLTYIIIIKSKHVCVCEHMNNICYLRFRVLIKAIFWFKKCYLVFNLFVTSKNGLKRNYEFTSSRI